MQIILAFNWTVEEVKIRYIVKAIWITQKVRQSFSQFSNKLRNESKIIIKIGDPDNNKLENAPSDSKTPKQEGNRLLDYSNWLNSSCCIAIDWKTKIKSSHTGVKIINLPIKPRQANTKTEVK